MWKDHFPFSPYSSQPLAWSTLFSPIPHLSKPFSGVPSQLASSCHPFSLFLQPSYYISYPFYSLNTWFFAGTLGLFHLQFCLPRMLFLWLFYLVLPYILPAKLKGTFSGIIYMTALFKGRSYSLPSVIWLYHPLSYDPVYFHYSTDHRVNSSCPLFPSCCCLPLLKCIRSTTAGTLVSMFIIVFLALYKNTWHIVGTHIIIEWIMNL